MNGTAQMGRCVCPILAAFTLAGINALNLQNDRFHFKANDLFQPGPVGVLLKSSGLAR